MCACTYISYVFLDYPCFRELLSLSTRGWRRILTCKNGALHLALAHASIVSVTSNELFTVPENSRRLAVAPSIASCLKIYGNSSSCGDVLLQLGNCDQGGFFYSAVAFLNLNVCSV